MNTLCHSIWVCVHPHKYFALFKLSCFPLAQYKLILVTAFPHSTSNHPEMGSVAQLTNQVFYPARPNVGRSSNAACFSCLSITLTDRRCRHPPDITFSIPWTLLAFNPYGCFSDKEQKGTPVSNCS
jgi:hypothetical protein